MSKQIFEGLCQLYITYNEQEIIDFKGKPLIEALPTILSPEEAYEKLSYYPPYDLQEANLPTHIV